MGSPDVCELVAASWRTTLSPVTVSAAARRPTTRPVHAFGRSEWLRLVVFYTIIALLHLVGWGLYAYYARRFPALVGLGFVAYVFGLRHAFDADHIAAVDDTTRLMLRKGEMPLGIGFFFSMGHSTIVLLLAIMIVFASALVNDHFPTWQSVGGIIGAGVAGAFLWLVGILNFIVLLGILKVWRQPDRGRHRVDLLDELVGKRGIIGRMFGGRLRRIVRRSWQMYPLGLLFGLGFDTASEVGLLAMTAGAATGDLPLAAVLSLPILFAAGMSALDTTDAVLMVKAYGWASAEPSRRMLYNIAVTSLSVVVALAIGTVELVQVGVQLLGIEGRLSGFVAAIDFGILGYIIVAVFMIAWAVAISSSFLATLSTTRRMAPWAPRNRPKR